MTDKLTDEDLQELEDWGTSPNPSTTRLLVKEVRALRAERAKPTQSDEESLQKAIESIGCWWYLTGKERLQIRAAFASIRAEGSAEREVEWAAGWHRVAETMCVIVGVSPALGADEMATAFRDAWENASAERAKLEAEVAELKTRLAEHNATWLDAQPAESGAMDAQ